MHGSRRKGPPKLALVAHVAEADQRIGDSGTHVGTHDHGNRDTHRQPACDHADDQRGDGRRRLNQGGRNNADNQPDIGVGGEGEQLLSLTSRCRLETGTDHADRADQHIDQAQYGQPLGPAVAAYRLRRV